MLSSCDHTAELVQHKIYVQCAVYSAQPGSMYGREIVDSSMVFGFLGCVGIRQTAEISGLDRYLGLFLAVTERMFEV